MISVRERSLVVSDEGVHTPPLQFWDQSPRPPSPHSSQLAEQHQRPSDQHKRKQRGSNIRGTNKLNHQASTAQKDKGSMCDEFNDIPAWYGAHGGLRLDTETNT